MTFHTTSFCTRSAQQSADAAMLQGQTRRFRVAGSIANGGGHFPLATSVNVRPSAGFLFSTCFEFDGFVTNTTPTIFAVRAPDQLRTLWTVDGAALDNNATNPFFPSTVIANGRAGAEIEFSFGGAALAAFNEGGGETPASYTGYLEINYLDNLYTYEGWEHFISFLSAPPDGTAPADSAAQVLTDLMRQIERNGSGFTLGVRSNGTTATVPDCTFAALDPIGRVFVRPEDIGNLNENIPVSVLQNTPEHFNFFPGVFFRRSSYVRQLRNVFTDPTGIAVGGDDSQPLQIAQVDFVPDSSDWLMVVDGVPSVVRLLHPAGSDWRTGPEIYENVVVPTIRAANGNASAAQFSRVIGAATNGGNYAELADRLTYSQYWRLLSPRQTQQGDNVEQFTINPQNDTAAP